MEQSRRESDRLNDEERESYLNQIPGPFKPEELNVIATDAAPASPRLQEPKQDFCNEMDGSLNVGMMLKIKRAFSRDSKRSSASRQNTSILMRQRKDKVNRKETQFLASHPPVPPRTRPFCIDFPSEQTLSVSVNDPESFHCAIGPILTMAQSFGILPISGIRRPNPSQLKFAIFSFRTAYTVFIIATVLMAIMSVINTIKVLTFFYIIMKGKIVITATENTIFYGFRIIGLITFFWLSPRWTTLQCDWRSMEQFIDRNKVERPKLRWKFYVITASIFFLDLVQCILIYTTNEYADNALYLTFFDDFIHLLMNFIWNFTDVFIMLVATGLAERYKTLNKHVVSATSEHRTIDWCGLREDYAALSCMVKKVDNNIGPIILLSFASNLYTICLYLFHSDGLTKPFNMYMYGTSTNTYIMFGLFIFLIGRTVTVTLLAARIYDQSKMILPLLHTCLASTYNVETEKLIYLLTTDDTMLTGMRFFSITRKFMLAVTGAIITYEIVLLQFNAAETDGNIIIKSLFKDIIQNITDRQAVIDGKLSEVMSQQLSNDRNF